MKKFLAALLSLTVLSQAVATTEEKVWTEEEVRELVEKYSTLEAQYAHTGLKINLDHDRYPDFNEGRYNGGYTEDGQYVQSVVYKRGKSHFVPFDISGSDAAVIAAAATAAVIFFANEQEVMNFVQDHKNDITEKVAFFGEGFGSEWPMYAAAGGYILGVITKNDGTKSYALMGAKAMLISGIATYALKNTFHRVRPSGGDPYDFGGPGAKFGSNVSFPSGHTTLAFSAATYIAETNKHRGPLIPILAYSAAAISAWSRVHDKAHWASDVAVGAALGHLITKAVLNSDTAKKGFLITPTMDFNGGYGISVTYTGRPKSYSSSCAKGITDQNEKIRRCIEAAFRDSGF